MSETDCRANRHCALRNAGAVIPATAAAAATATTKSSQYKQPHLSLLGVVQAFEAKCQKQFQVQPVAIGGDSTCYSSMVVLSRATLGSQTLY